MARTRSSGELLRSAGLNSGLLAKSSLAATLLARSRERMSWTWLVIACWSSEVAVWSGLAWVVWVRFDLPAWMRIVVWDV